MCPWTSCFAESYLQERRRLIDPERAWPAMPPPGDPRRAKLPCLAPHSALPSAMAAAAVAGASTAGTSYFGVIDRHGNIFSCTPSEGAKSGPIIPGTGLVLCLRGSQSKVEPGHPAALAPGKRPRLTPAPALVLRDGATGHGPGWLWWRPYPARHFAGLSQPDRVWARSAGSRGSTAFLQL